MNEHDIASRLQLLPPELPDPVDRFEQVRDRVRRRRRRRAAGAVVAGVAALAVAVPAAWQLLSEDAAAPAPAGPAQDDDRQSGQVLDQPVEEVMVDPYVFASSPQEFVDWGSHVVFVQVLAEREVDPRYPMALTEGQVGREVDLVVQQVLWSHPDAVTPVAEDDRVSLEVSPGWVGEHPAVLEGTQRLEVGRTYTLTLVDSYHDGDQYLDYLFGTIQQASAADAATLKEQVSVLSPDPDRGPRPGETWDARYVGGGGLN